MKKKRISIDRNEDPYLIYALFDQSTSGRNIRGPFSETMAGSIWIRIPAPPIIPGFGVFNMGPLTAIGGNGSRGGGDGGRVDIGGTGPLRVTVSVLMVSGETAP
jgi:hypothetical protein